MKKALLLLYLFTICIYTTSNAQKAIIDSLKKELGNLDEEELIDAYFQIMWNSRDLSPDTTIYYGEKILNITEGTSEFKDRAKVLNLIGVACRNKGHYSKAFDFFKQALLQADVSNNQIQKGYSYINISNLFFYEGDNYESLKNINEAIIIANKTGDAQLIGYAYQVFGNIQLSRGKYELALENYHHSLNQRKSIGKQDLIASAHQSIGEAYLQAGSPYDARVQFLKAKEIAIEADYESLIYTCEASLGETYFNSSSDSLGIALNHYGKAYKGFLKLKQQLKQAKILEKIAQVYLLQNSISKSIEAANKGLVIAEKLPAIQEALLLSDVLSKAYNKRGDIIKEAEALRKYIYYIHLYQDEEKLRKAQMIENNMAIAQKQEEINLLNQKNTLSEEKIVYREYALISVIVTLVLMGVIIYLINQKKKRFKEFSNTLKVKTKEIQDQKFIIGEKVVQVLELNEQLTKKNDELKENLVQTKKIHEQLARSEKMAIVGQMMAVVAHEINNPLNFISNNIVPISDNLKEVQEMVKEQEIDNKEEFQEDIEESILLLEGIDDGVKRIREISQDLKNAVKSNHGVPKPLDVNQSINTTLNLLSKKYKYDGIDLQVELEDHLPEVVCLGGKISQVFINVIDNAYQVVKENDNDTKVIKISTKKLKDDRIGISISDNGGGIKDLDHLFEAFYTTKKEGLGLGLIISKDIVEQHKGSINAFNNKEGGATFTIQLPLEGIQV
ncbi:GHKL domain-containing protein [Flammeovirga sp. MY04]|uniref:tetratricopeptide repeat-containing sensor histidine kinase n=1 Tax=Flammeovirga sp. MY04 TaxID=1191459 RepID=UPI00080610EC|nr:ATP-binding protein [Flammeovirga sp. MY04]ANQ49075.1 GHKL domain-containing protein [Flammeovirga sp. MY04]